MSLRKESRIGRRLAIGALVLDCVAMAGLLLFLPHHANVAVGAVLILAGLAVLATFRPRMGTPMMLIRAPVALVLLIGGLVAAWFYVLAAAETGALLVGLAGASSVSRERLTPLPFPCSRCGQYPSTRRGRRSASQRLCPACWQRRDEIATAAVHLGALTLLVAVLVVDGRPLDAVAFVGMWSFVMWGAVGVHEVGHALAAKALGNEVRQVRVGLGLRIAALGMVSVHAVPGGGLTEWIANEDTMTTRREALIVAAGPVANAVLGLAMAVPAWLRRDPLLAVLAAGSCFTAFINLVPSTHGTHPGGASDGARLRSLLRPPV